MKKTLLWFIVVLLIGCMSAVFVLSGCKEAVEEVEEAVEEVEEVSEEETEEPAEKTVYEIGYIQYSSDAYYQMQADAAVLVADYINERVDDFDVEMIFVTSEGNPCPM